MQNAQDIRLGSKPEANYLPANLLFFPSEPHIRNPAKRFYNILISMQLLSQDFCCPAMDDASAP